MSRARIGCVIACFGILITTGGCAESATAPQAATTEASTNRSSNPTDADDRVAPVAPKPVEEVVYTTSSGHIAGGGRAEP